MGLAERFKNRLDNRDIFTKTNIEKQFKEQDIEFISKPITHETNIQQKEIHLGLKSEPIIELSTDIKSNKFEDLEDEDYEEFDDHGFYDDSESPTYGRYAGSYAQDEMGYSDDDIDTIFDGDPDAYWNID